MIRSLDRDPYQFEKDSAKKKDGTRKTLMMNRAHAFLSVKSDTMQTESKDTRRLENSRQVLTELIFDSCDSAFGERTSGLLPMKVYEAELFLYAMSHNMTQHAAEENAMNLADNARLQRKPVPYGKKVQLRHVRSDTSRIGHHHYITAQSQHAASDERNALRLVAVLCTHHRCDLCDLDNKVALWAGSGCRRHLKAPGLSYGPRSSCERMGRKSVRAMRFDWRALMLICRWLD